MKCASFFKFFKKNLDCIRNAIAINCVENCSRFQQLTAFVRRTEPADGFIKAVGAGKQRVGRQSRSLR